MPFDHSREQLESVGAHVYRDSARPYWTAGFKIEDRVRIHKQPECEHCAETDCDGAEGVIEEIYDDRELYPREAAQEWESLWGKRRPDPAASIRGHNYWVRTDRPLRDTGFMGRLHRKLHDRDYYGDGGFFAATELELLK